MDVNIDHYDKRILFELDKNARAKISTIAKKIRRSKQFVKYRIRKLEDEKIILGYTAVIDYSRLGYTSIRVYLRFHDITPKQQEALEEDLAGDSEVWWLVSLEGPWDVGYAMAVKSPLDFYAYWDRIMKKYRKFISRSSVVVYTHIKQYPKSYLIGQENIENGTLIGASKEQIPVDGKDLALLKLISDRARMPLIEIASILKTGPQPIRGRMERLEKAGVIQGHRATIDFSALGYRYYKAYLRLVSTEKLAELENFCMRHPNILNTNRTIGGSDFEIELQAKSFEEFEAIMNSLRGSFPGMIDDYEFVISRKEKKMVYFPFMQG